MRNIVFLSFLTINIILIFSSNCYSFEWCFVASSKDNYYFVDSESIKARDTDITFWLCEQDIKTGKVIYKKRYTINCEKETIAVRDVIRFSSEGIILEIISYGRNFKWVEIRPNSKIQVIEQILCEGGVPRKNIKEYLKKPFANKEN